MEMLDEKGFVFIDECNKVYWCCIYNSEPWFMYWHEGNKAWVTYRKANQTDIFLANENAISNELAETYHEKHREFING